MSQRDLSEIACRARSTLRAAVDSTITPMLPMSAFRRRSTQRRLTRAVSVVAVGIVGVMVTYTALLDSGATVVATVPSDASGTGREGASPTSSTASATATSAPPSSNGPEICFTAGHLPPGWKPSLIPGPAYAGGPSFNTDETQVSHWAGRGRYLSPGPQEGYIDVAFQAAAPAWPTTWPQTETVPVLDTQAIFGLMTFGPENKYWAVFEACHVWWVLSSGGIDDHEMKRVLEGLRFA